MKVYQEANEVTSSGVMANAGFGISMNSKVAKMLSEQVYSDPILAVVREYICNAQDAHTMVGNTQPIHVTVPTSLNPVWAVRDFGPGLSQAQIMGTESNGFRGLFNTYGHSGKDDSDLFIGGFGLGSKAGFAYTKQSSAFTVTSWHGGIKHVFTAHMNESGVPSITMLGCDPSTEPSGVEITIPVAIKDISIFVNRTAAVCKYLAVPPKFLGYNIEIEKSVYTSTGKGWKRREYKGYSSQSYAIIGGIGYPIELKHFTHDIQVAMNCGFDVEVPIGAVELALSREALSYDERTINYLNDRFEEITKDIRKNYQDELSSSTKSYYEKCVAFSLIKGDPIISGKNTSYIQHKYTHVDGRVITDTFKYRHDPIAHPDLAVSFTDIYHALHGKLTSANEFTLHLTSSPAHFVWNDGTTHRLKPKLRRLFEMLKDHPKGSYSSWPRVIIIKTASENIFKAVVKSLGDSPHTIHLNKLEDMFDPEEATPSANKRDATDLRRNVNILYNSRGSTAKSYFSSKEIDFNTKDTIHYAWTKNYKLYSTGDCDSGEIAAEKMARIMQVLSDEEVFKGNLWLIPSIYECHIAGKSNFVNIYDLAKTLTVSDELRKKAESFDAKFEKDLEEFKNRIHLRLKEAVPEYTGTKLCKAVSGYSRDTSKIRSATHKANAIINLHDTLKTGVTIEPIKHSENKSIDFSKYPMLSCIKEYYYMNKEHWTTVVNYIKDCEK